MKSGTGRFEIQSTADVSRALIQHDIRRRFTGADTVYAADRSPIRDQDESVTYHSDRSAVIGSTSEARRAGTYAASAATASRMKHDSRMVNGSLPASP